MTRAAGWSFWGQSPNSLSLRLALRVRCKALQRNWCLTPITRNLRCSIPAGVGRTRFAQTTAALDTASICAARPSQTGLGGKIGFGIGLRRGRAKRVLASPHPYSSPKPVGLGRGAQAKADKGSRLSEPKASSSETPLLPSTAGCSAAQRRGPRPSGRLSFGYFSLATQRKVPRPPGRDPACRRTTGLQVNDDFRPSAEKKK